MLYIIALLPQNPTRAASHLTLFFSKDCRFPRPHTPPICGVSAVASCQSPSPSAGRGTSRLAQTSLWPSHATPARFRPTSKNRARIAAAALLTPVRACVRACTPCVPQTPNSPPCDPVSKLNQEPRAQRNLHPARSLCLCRQTLIFIISHLTDEQDFFLASFPSIIRLPSPIPVAPTPFASPAIRRHGCAKGKGPPGCAPAFDQRCGGCHLFPRVCHRLRQRMPANARFSSSCKPARLCAHRAATARATSSSRPAPCNRSFQTRYRRSTLPSMNSRAILYVSLLSVVATDSQLTIL